MKWLSKLFSRQPQHSVAADVPESVAGSEAEACKNRGNAHWANGEVDAALACYHEAVAIDPNYAEAFNNLGFVCIQRQDYEDAERYLGRAVAINSELANAHYNFGMLFQQTERSEQATTSFQKAIAIDPKNANAHYSLGSLCLQLGRDNEAIPHFQTAIDINPNHFMAHHGLAMAYQRLGKLDEALDSIARTIELNRGFFAAYFNRGLILQLRDDIAGARACFEEALSLCPTFPEPYYELGNQLREENQLEASVLYFQKAIELNPDYAKAHNNLGVVLMKQEKTEDALSCFREAIRAKPDLAAAHSNIGELLYRLGKLDESLIWADKALALDPLFADAYITKGLSLKYQGRLAEAERAFRKALEINPQHRSARYNLGTVLLARGELAEGWAHYGHRFFRDSGTLKRDFPQPLWNGEELRDKTLLVWGDQGIGDEILFATMFPEIIARARHCIIECAPKLVALFASSFPEAIVVPCIHPPDPATLKGDFQIAAADLARWLRPSVSSFPSRNDPLTPDPERVVHWKTRLAELGPGLKVGFCWRSRNLKNCRSLQYANLRQWGPILTVPGVHFVNLQYDECTAELAEASERFGIPLHVFPEVDLFDDLHEAAALTKALDLVVTAATAASGLAAATGVPTWEMGYGSTWVSLGTDHVPWFPSQRMYIRRWDQTWEETIAVVSGDLATRVSGQRLSKDR